MTTDVRARRPHDLISIVVSESLAASTDGSVKNSRASNANSGISGLIGTLKAGNALQNLIAQEVGGGVECAGHERDEFESEHDVWRAGGGGAAERDAGD